MPAYDFLNGSVPMPNIENLKKQAKLYLRWHREGYYPVAARIRSLLPDFRQLNDPQVLAHEFKLSDALSPSSTGIRSSTRRSCEMGHG